MGPRRVLAVARRLWRADDGAISVLTAIIALVMIGFTGLAVDFGSAVYWQHRLQTATDAAAMAASFDTSRASEIAAQAVHANGAASAAIEGADVGNYVDDPEISDAARFTPASNGNAVKVSSRYDAPMYFIRLFTGAPTMPVRATAVAYNLPLAGIAAGTGAADADVDDLNDALDQLSGGSFDLTQAERDALDAQLISIFRLFDQFAELAGTPSASIEDIMASSVDLETLANAAAAALLAQAGDGATSEQLTAYEALIRIAQEAGDAPPVAVADFVSLDAHEHRAARDLVSQRSDVLAIAALPLLLGYAQAAHQDELVDLSASLSIPGIANVAAEAVLDRGAASGGGPAVATVGPAGSSVRSSRGRIRLTVTALQPIAVNLGLIHLSLSLSFPVIADIAYGTATITGISCGTDILATTDVEVAAQSGAVRLYLGSVADDALEDFATPLSPAPAQVISAPLVGVRASGTSDVAQSGATEMHFDRADIQSGAVKSADGTPTVAAAFADVASHLSIVVNNAPLGTSALISGLVQARVSTILNALEPQLQSVADSIGLRAGYMDVRATGVRCGIPALVI